MSVRLLRYPPPMDGAAYDPNDSPGVARARLRDFLNREGGRAIKLMRARLGFSTREMAQIMGYTSPAAIRLMESRQTTVSARYYVMLCHLCERLEAPERR